MTRKGFTLIEVLVVLGIICIISGVSIIGTKWADDIGEKTSDKQESAALGMLVVQYKLHMDVYPLQLEDLTKRNTAGYGPYISKIPQDSYGRNLNYKTNNNLGFAIWSNGSNGVNDSGIGITGISGDDSGIVGY